MNEMKDLEEKKIRWSRRLQN